MTAFQYKVWKFKRTLPITLGRILGVIGILFLFAFWTSKPPQKQIEVANRVIAPVEAQVIEITPTAKPTPKVIGDVEKISAFLKKQGSPLPVEPFIRYGKQYGIDPKIMVAISITESSGGKNLCHGEKGFNPFGLLYRKRLANGKIVRECIEFSSFEKAIEYEAKLLAGRLYKKAGKTTIAQIGSSYDPGNPEWVTNTKKYYNLINR